MDSMRGGTLLDAQGMPRGDLALRFGPQHADETEPGDYHPRYQQAFNPNKRGLSENCDYNRS